MNSKLTYSLLIFLSFTLSFYSQDKTWNGSSSSQWHTDANWTPTGVPTSGQSVSIPNVTTDPVIFTTVECAALQIESGAVLTTFTSGSVKLTAASIEIQSGGELNISFGEIECTGKLDHDGLLTISGGLLDVNGEYESSASSTEAISAGDITVFGAWTAADDDAFTPDGGTVTFDGTSNQNAAQNASSYFNNLAISNSNSSDVDFTADLDVNGTLAIGSGADLDISAASNLEIEGTFTNSGTFTSSGETITFNGSSTTNAPRLDTDASLNIVINKSSASNEVNFLGNGSFTNFTVSQGVADIDDNTFTVSGTSDIDGTLSASTGTYNADGAFDATGGNITFSGGGNLILSNTSVTSLGTFTKSTSTVKYDQNVAQNIDDVNYYNLTIEGGSNKTFTGNTDVSNILDINGGVLVLNNSSHKITVAAVTLDASFINISDGEMECSGTFDHNGGNLTMSGGTLDLNGDYESAANSNSNISDGNITIAGNWTAAADDAFNPTGGTVTFDGSSDKNLTFNASSNFHNLTISNTGSSDVDVANDLDINGNLVISANADFDISAASNLSIALDFTNSGTFTTGNETITFDGASSASESCPAISNADVNIVVNKSDASGTVTFGNCSVNQFTVTDGIASIGSSTVTADAAITVSSGAELTISSGSFTADAASDIDGTLSITSTGTYDANADFDATGAAVTFSGAGSIEMSGSVTKLGTSFTEGSGTIKYDGAGAQGIFNTTYNNLIIDQNSTKSATADLDIDGNLTIDNSATLDMSASNFNMVIDGNYTLTSGTFNSRTGTVTFNGAGAQTLTSGSSSFYNLTTATNGTNVTIQADVTVTNNLTIASSTTLDAGSNRGITVGGDFANSGTFTDQQGTVTFNGTGTLTSGGNDLYNVTTSGTGTVTLGDALTIANDLSIGANTTLDVSGSNYAIGIKGDFANSGTFTSGSGTVTFNGSGAQTITTGGVGTDNDFNNVTITNSGTLADGSDVETSDAIKVNGTLDVTDGQFMPATSSDFAIVTLSSVNGKLKPASGSSITVSGNWTTAIGGSSSFDGNSGTVTFDGSGQSLTNIGISFYNLSTSGTTILTNGDALTVANDLTIALNTRLIAGNNQPINVGGNWSNSGTFSALTGTVFFNGSGAQTISGTNTFYDLTINNTHGSLKVSANGSTLTVQDDLLVSDGIFESASDYDDVTISSGATFELTGDITVSGDWSNSGTFTPNSNTVTFDGGGAQSLTSGGSSFYDLTTATASTDITIQDALVVTNHLTIAASTTLDAGSDKAISVGGNWSNSGTFTSASGTVTFNGSGAQTVTTGGVGTGNDFNNVTITNTAASPGTDYVQTSGAIKVDGTLDVTYGQFVPAASSDFVNVTLSSSNGKFKHDVGTITVSGTWNNSGGSSASFEATNAATVTFDGAGAQSLTSGGISFNFFKTATSGTVLTIQDALIVAKTLEIGANSTLDAGSNQAISVGVNWTNSGTFTSASGTVTFNGTISQVITTGGVGAGNDFYNLTIANTGNPVGNNVTTSGEIKVTGTLDVFDGLFIPATSSEFLDVTVSTEGFLETASSSSITVSGNWSDAAGTFTPNTGTVIMDGTSKTIATGASNEFYNLTLSGSVTTSTANDVEVEGTLTVSGSLTVNPGDELTLEDATVSGTLTIDADGSNNATLDFSEADNPVFAVTGTLNLDGEDASNRAIVSSDDDSRIDFDISSAGVLNADYFTMTYPTAAGFSINSSGTQVVSFGNFDGPDGATGVLLDLSGTGTISSPSSAGQITGFNFENTGAGGGTNGINVKSNSSTQLITFTSYGGTLASDATVGEANDDDGDNKLYFFNNEYYSSGSTNAPNAAASWFSLTNGTGLSPSDFTNSSHKFIVQSGNTYTATADWTVAGEIQVIGELSTGAFTTTMAGLTDVDGTLTIPNGGVYDANGDFNADGGGSGAVTLTGTGRLRLSATGSGVSSLGNLSTGAGTVEYDGGAQEVLADTYFNLEIDQAGTKTAQGSVIVNGTLTVQSAGTPIYDIAATTTTVTGTSTIAGTLNIDGSGVYDANGDFAASGAITMAGTARLQLSAANSGVSSLGTLDDAAGTVEYDGGTQNVLVDTYYNLEIDQSGVKTAQGTITAAGTLTVQSAATYDIAATTTTVTGNSRVIGTLDIDGSGVFDANGGTFNASSGNINFSGAGFLKILGNASSFGTMNTDAGTVVYDKNSAQTVRNRNYYNLTIDGNGSHSLGNSNAINVLGDLVVNETGSTVFNMHQASVTVTGTTDVDGTLNITTGTFNADGEFDATGGNVTFTDAGALVLSNTVTDLGTFTKSTSTVTYDEVGAQTIDNVTYNNLIIDQNATKTAANNLDIDGNLTLTNSATLSMSGSNYTLDLEGDFTITSGTFTAGTGNHDVKGNWDDSGTSGGFTPSAGTIALSGDSKTITSHTNNNFFNLAIAAGTKTAENALDINGALSITSGTLDMNAAEDNTLDLEGDFSIASSGTFTAQGGIHNMAGNWNCSGGTFQSTTEGTVLLSGASKTITTGASNEFFNLTVSNSASTAGSNDIEVEGTLTVSGALTVSPGDELTLEDATVSGTLTVDADGSNSATIDFSDASSADFDVSGTLVLDGEDATNRAIVTSDDGTRIDVDITGTLTADYFTFQYPNITGLFVTGSNAQTISFGAFDYPFANGTLLNLTSATNITNDVITGCSFGNTSSVSGATNVTADGTTDVVTFTVFSGVLASDASTAEGNDVDASDKIIWFDNKYYSNGNTNPNAVGNWHTGTNGTGLNPSNFANAIDKFIVQSGNTYTATGDWTVAGEVEVDGALVTGASTVTMAGKTDVDGTLTISNGGVYDANGEFDATGGTIDQDGTSALRMAGTVTSLGSSLDNAAGTVEYDGGAQNVLADDYFNLEIDQAGTKTAQGAVNVAGTLTVQSTGTPIYDIAATTTTVTGTSTIAGTLNINGSGVYDANGDFAASGAITMDGTARLQLSATGSGVSNLGTLDDAAGTVEYDGGTQNVLADTYYNLEIDQAGTKTAQGAVNVNGTMTVQNTGLVVYDIAGTTTTVTGTTTVNHTNGTNSGTIKLTTGTFEANGATDINGKLTINGSGTYDADDNFDATGATVEFTNTGGNLKLGGATVTSLGNTLTEGTGTIEYDYAGNQTVLSETYYNLTINNATGTKTAGGALDIDGDLTVTAGILAVGANSADVASGKTVNIDGTLSISSGTFTANGPTDIDGTLSITTTGVYDADNTFTAASGIVNFDGAGFLKCSNTVSSLGALSTDNGTVEYDGGTQDVLADAYYNLEIDQAGTKTAQGTVTAAGTLTVQNNGLVVYDIAGTNTTVTGATTVNHTGSSNSGTINITTGTFEANGTTDINGTLTIDGAGTYDANNSFDAAGATVQFTGSGGFLKLGGTVTSLGTFTENTGTVDYDYAGDQSVKTRTYYNLNLKNSGTKRTPASGSTLDVTVSNDFTIDNGVTFNLDLGNDNLVVQGDFTNNGTFTGTNQSVTFSGASSAGETSSLINDASVDLIVSKTHASGGVTFQGASSFDNVTISDGYLDIGAYTFTADELITISAAGTLRIPNSGTFNADGQLTTSGEIDFTGFGSQGDLICSSTSANTFGTMDAAAGTVTFDGSSSQAIPVETFFNLKNSNTNGLTMSGDATVNGELNFNVAADITTGASTLTIGGTGTIANAADDRHINVDNTSGYLAKTFGSATDFSYPVGNGTILRPIKLTTNAGSTTFKLRYDDNRFTGAGVGAASGNVSGGGFASGHISGFDGSNTDVTKGYYYDVRRTSGSANASLYVSWTDDDDYGTNGNVFSPDLTGIAWGTWNGSRWDDISSTASGNINIGNITTASAVTDFSNFFFTLGSTDGENNLPIDLISFEGECLDNQTNLEFVVASQVNNEYFTIERSKNLFSWEKLGDVTGGGTNNEETTYSYKDVSPNSGDNYYRLSQTDIDGTTESFSPIVVNCNSKVDNYRIYPNPTTNLITIEFELEYFQGDNIQLVLRDLKGTKLKTNSVALSRGYNSFNVDLSELPKGFYMIQFQGTKNHIPERRVVKL